MTRILITTVDREFGLYDYYRENAPANMRWRFGWQREISYGLRFLRQNIPEIEILEYPTRANYRAALRKGWDAVGFSFCIEETNVILEMAEDARRAGVKHLWAGNYGALTPAVQPGCGSVDLAARRSDMRIVAIETTVENVSSTRFTREI